MASLSYKIGNAIDIAVALFSPERGLNRHARREALEKYRSGQYAAAKTTKSTGAWSPVDSGVNDIIGASSASVRARVRQLVRDFPYFARAVNVLVDYTVGEGIQFQSRVQDSNGNLNQKLIQQIEDAFRFWADGADFAGKLHFYEMMRLAKRQDLEPGEFLLIKKQSREKLRYLPYCLQMVEADWLADLGAKASRKNSTIEQGIEYDTITGQRLYYHFTDPDGWGKTMRVKAEDVIHGFETLRPGQLRGISPFAPGVLVADDLSSLMDAEIDAAKMASKYLAMITTPDPASRQLGVGVTDGDNDEKIEELENAIIEYLRPGENIEIASNPRPGANFPPFVRLILCMFSVTTGAPYELLSGDYQGMNYSTGKMVRNDFRQFLRPTWTRHIRQFCTPAVTPFFQAANLKGKLKLPSYYANPAPYHRIEWQPPGMESNDPLRESKANIDDVKALHRSPQEIIKARGRDPEDVVKEAAVFKALCEKHGVAPEEVSTAMANNPAAVGQQDGTKSLREITDTLDEILLRLE